MRAVTVAANALPTLVQALTAMQAEGLLKGGSEGCSIVAYGDRWYNSDSVRFFDDEPVRHKLLDILVCFGARKLPCALAHAQQSDS